MLYHRAPLYTDLHWRHTKDTLADSFHVVSCTVYAELCAVPDQLFYAVQSLVSAVKQLADDPESKQKNRVGVLLGTKQAMATKTLTHVMWVLFNVLPAGSTQKPHRHTPTALDFAISAPSKGAAHCLVPHLPGIMSCVTLACVLAVCRVVICTGFQWARLSTFESSWLTFITGF